VAERGKDVAEQTFHLRGEYDLVNAFELEAELLESIAQVDRGETISAKELLERLRRIA